ncbi:MAG: phosphoenolpyruvate carboxykinase (ATP) [Ardenticatenaceae bacterium]|nr:phosphoenolpyruvate carboxykinase (ATP) [Ardenticatenaceae bacterium]MCB9442885.1 phosphoenolpyruvate carboxykinase (ATP) [Ardenticatenaceae bacterium]
MNNILNIKTPAEGQASALKSDYDLENHGLRNWRQVYWNLPTEALYEEIVFRGEGRTTKMGAMLVNTGKHSARAAQDKFVVREAESEENIWWGEYNRPISPEQFNEVYNRLQGYLQGRDLFVQDAYAGADPEYRLPVRIISEYAWHSHFARNMFILPQSREEYRQHVPDFTVICVPSFKAFESIDGTRTSTFILLNFAQRIAIIGDSAYSGEIKKSIFTVMNYLLPLEGVMTMHCSANQGDDGDVGLFFGLSGTGKTTLSADPSRHLIGDDEHGWSDDGVFNFEGGCYAKVIRLSPTAEPEIYACTERFGTILENVVYDPVTRLIDLDDPSLTENTRASYPLEYIGNALPDKRGGHPKNIIFLTCDAQGVLPPISRLSSEQAMYHFISGYTSKVGGTEVGLGEEPQITFSACFGAPFMVHHPMFYADLLRRKVERYGVTCWLLNTGWTGGAYGVGKRISIKYTRALLNAALNGELDNVEYYTDPIFGFEVPKSCPNVPEDVLYPAQAWSSEKDYMSKYRSLAARFVDNFKKYAPECPPEVRAAGPKM